MAPVRRAVVRLWRKHAPKATAHRCVRGAANDAAVGLSRHAQVTTELRTLIESGEFRPEGTFPTEAKIQERYNVSRRTAHAALKGLENDRPLYTVGRRRLVAGHD